MLTKTKSRYNRDTKSEKKDNPPESRQVGDYGVTREKKMFKTKLVLGFMLIMLLAMNASSLFAFAGGDGSAEHPYQVSNATELNDVRNFLSSYFIQNADIDLNVSPYNTGSGWEPIGISSPYFTGNYDGDGHSIAGLFIDHPGTDNIGFFGLAFGATIQNLGVTDVNITGKSSVGGLVGYNRSSTVSNSYSTGIVSGSEGVGGLVGYNYSSTVSNSYSTGTVTGNSNYVGGLVGFNSSSTVSNSYSRGDVTRASGTNVYFGGFCGNNGSTIQYCYSTGSVYYTGTSDPTDKGFCGSTCTNNNNFWDSDASNQSTATGATCKTTAQMKTQSTFTNWNFDTIWEIVGGDGANYPRLIDNPDPTLPVILSTFTVQYLNNSPTLYWTTQSETDNLGWNVYRNTEEDFSSAQKITNELIPGSGTTTEPSYYNFNDNDETLEIGTTYWYWLENIDLGGETHYSNSVNITIPSPGEEPGNIEPPVVYILNTAPNPMNSSTYFNFTLDKSVETTISIYNIKGELVRTLPRVWADADADATVYWNGKDENGNRLQAGVYLYKLLVNGKTYKTNKLILMRQKKRFAETRVQEIRQLAEKLDLRRSNEGKHSELHPPSA